MIRQLSLRAVVGFACIFLASHGREAFAGSAGFLVGQTNADGSVISVINGVPQNVNITDLTQRAEDGDAPAQVSLAMCLYDGEHGAAQNYAEAYKWATLADAQKQKGAKHLVEELELFMTEAQIHEGRDAAKAFLEKSKSNSQEDSN